MMHKKLTREIERQKKHMEQLAAGYGLLAPRVVQIPEPSPGKKTRPQVITMTDENEECFPEKMDLITGLLDFLENRNDAAGNPVACSIYGEHIIGEEEEAVYIQVKQGTTITHQVSRIKRAHLRVNAGGKLCGDIRTERFVHYQND